MDVNKTIKEGLFKTVQLPAKGWAAISHCSGHIWSLLDSGYEPLGTTFKLVDQVFCLAAHVSSSPCLKHSLLALSSLFAQQRAFLNGFFIFRDLAPSTFVEPLPKAPLLQLNHLGNWAFNKLNCTLEPTLCAFRALSSPKPLITIFSKVNMFALTAYFLTAIIKFSSIALQKRAAHLKANEQCRKLHSELINHGFSEQDLLTLKKDLSNPSDQKVFFEITLHKFFKEKTRIKNGHAFLLPLFGNEPSGISSEGKMLSNTQLIYQILYGFSKKQISLQLLKTLHIPTDDPSSLKTHLISLLQQRLQQAINFSPEQLFLFIEKENFQSYTSFSLHERTIQVAEQIFSEQFPGILNSSSSDSLLRQYITSYGKAYNNQKQSLSAWITAASEIANLCAFFFRFIVTFNPTVAAFFGACSGILETSSWTYKKYLIANSPFPETQPLCFV